MGGESGYLEEDGPRHTYDIEDGESPSKAVVYAVASVRNREPTLLPSLHERIDPSALDVLFEDTRRNGPRTDGCVSFDYCDCRVSVFADGRVVVQERNSA